MLCYLQKLTHPILLLIFFNQTGFAQSPKYSNEFLSIGVSAKAHAMANAQVAHINDITAAFWNPAGLARLDSNALQISAMHAEWFAGIAKYDYIGMGKSTKKSGGASFALSFIRFAVDQIPNTLSLVNEDGVINYDNITEFSSADYALLFSFAKGVKKIKGLTVGANTKVIRRVVGRFGKAWGFGIDIGAQYAFRQWQFGLTGKDITTTYNAWDFTFTDKERNVFIHTGNDIPVNAVEITRPTFLLGFARSIHFAKRHFELLTELNFAVTTDGNRNVLLSGNSISADPRLGFQLGYCPAKKSILDNKSILYEPRDFAMFLRFGIGNFQRIKSVDTVGKQYLSFQPNFGVGIQIKNLVIDYALTDLGNVSDVLYSHVFSLRVDLLRKGRKLSYILSPRRLLKK